MSRILFNIAAKCDKAGRSQNQDNFWVCPNLDKISDASAIGNDTDVELGDKGALLVVADGMGGMKSGEKASEFVIEGIKKQFANIPESILHDDNAIIAFIRNAIVQSDQMIKAYAHDHRESEGMGSTIVLVWMLGEKAYCGWCGDSRIYCYNPQNKLVRLSHDHSYVQSLVDEGKIAEEDAFDHPDGNIITRSLGDSGEAANPETKIYPIHRRDVFMLCSDGLCGLLNDEQIENILADNCTSSEEALKNLWAHGQQKGWTDNATIEVACVTDGGATPTRKAIGYDTDRPKPVMVKNKPVQKDTNVMPNFWQANKQYFLVLGIVALVAVGIILFFGKKKKAESSSHQEFTIEQTEEPNNTNNTIQENVQPSTPNEVNTPQQNEGGVQHQPAKPGKTQKPGQPSKPGQQQGANAGNVDGQNNQQGNTPEPAQQQGPKTVSEEFLDLMDNTYNSVNAVNGYIAKASERKYFTPKERIELKNFKQNAHNLNTKPDVKVLNKEQKERLARINNTSKQIDLALKKWPVHEESQTPSRRQQRHGQGQGQEQEQDDDFDGGMYNVPVDESIYQRI